MRADDAHVVARGCGAELAVVLGEVLALRGDHDLEDLPEAAGAGAGLADGRLVVEGVAGMEEPAVAVANRVGGVAAGVVGIATTWPPRSACPVRPAASASGWSSPKVDHAGPWAQFAAR